MGTRTDFPSINYVFGYLHPNWYHTYDWNGGEPEYKPIIRLFKVKDSPETLQKAIVELKELKKFGESFDDEEWYDYFMTDSSLGYYPPGVGLTYKEWLEDVLIILEEPMEKTNKHFIPEFIG